MNLVNSLPDFVEFQGERYAVHTDFRVWIYVDKLLSSEVSPTAKAAKMLEICYKKHLPPQLSAATELLLDFYCGGRRGSETACGKEKRIYDFEQDADLFYAAFLQQYGIDLTEEKLHWWKFLALFRALDGDCKLSEVMRFRATDVTKLEDSRQKAFYRRMKRLYRLREESGDRKSDEALAKVLSDAVE